MIAIIDYGASNLSSVVKAVARLGYSPKVVSRSKEVGQAEVVILPGVGAAGDAMERLQTMDMVGIIRQVVKENRPFLGICLGLQLLFSSTEEDGQSCLNLIPGVVKKFPTELKVPHMGWNQLKLKIAHPLFAGIPDNSYFYFAHSYYVEPEDKSAIAGETDYGIVFASLIIKGNLAATQFHLEKSGVWGLKMLNNFLRQTARG
jgi:glutamine amidotransferase